MNFYLNQKQNFLNLSKIKIRPYEMVLIYDPHHYLFINT